MTKRSSSRSSGRSRSKNKNRRGWYTRILQLAVISACAGAAYLVWLDYRVHSEFEGSKWTIPARVYASPPDVYMGQRLAPGELEQSLRGNNYRATARLSGPGQYRTFENGFEIYLRAFDYWDGQVDSGRYRIEIQSDRVTLIEAVESGAVVPVFRLEPELIGKIYPDHNEDRSLVGKNEIPAFLINALLVVEDRDFYDHFGLDFRGILRAFWVNLRSQGLSQGGSTLTQQLVKNFFLTQERTITRKLNEMFMAVLLERRYGKQDILHAYINEVYLGQNGARAIHGFGTASEFYFNKPLLELRDDQLALLVALVRGASYYNPQRNPERALTRRNLVLRLMSEQSYLDDANVATLQKRPMDITTEADGTQQKYHAFLDLAKRQLLDDYRLDDLKNEGLRIYTTLDPTIQNHLDKATTARLTSLEQQHALGTSTLESASVIIKISNGEILAINGGRNTNLTGFNRALEAKRPVGSLIKPFVYLTALSRPEQYNLLTPIEDKVISMKQPDGTIWQPDNYDKTVHGAVSLMESLVNSYNLATIELGLETGLDNIITTLRAAGMSAGIRAYPSLLLGAVDLSPLEITEMYQGIANGGFKVPLNVIREVLDSEARPLQRRELNVSEVFDSGAVFLTNYLLTRVVENGTASQLSRYFPDTHTLAGKTGTTNESRDSWFVGYDDEILGVTWVGRDDNQPTPLTGASGAMQIWADTMQAVSVRPLQLVEPGSISWTEALQIHYDGDCLDIGTVPYIGTKHPDNTLSCQTTPDRGGSGFNPFNWFN